MTNPNDAAYGHGAENGHCCGLTKREYFAAEVLQGMICNPSMLAAFADKYEPTEVANYISKAACDAADKLIAALNK